MNGFYTLEPLGDPEINWNAGGRPDMDGDWTSDEVYKRGEKEKEQAEQERSKFKKDT